MKSATKPNSPSPGLSSLSEVPDEVRKEADQESRPKRSEVCAHSAYTTSSINAKPERSYVVAIFVRLI